MIFIYRDLETIINNYVQPITYYYIDNKLQKINNIIGNKVCLNIVFVNKELLYQFNCSSNTSEHNLNKIFVINKKIVGLSINEFIDSFKVVNLFEQNHYLNKIVSMTNKYEQSYSPISLSFRYFGIKLGCKHIGGTNIRIIYRIQPN